VTKPSESGATFAPEDSVSQVGSKNLVAKAKPVVETKSKRTSGWWKSRRQSEYVCHAMETFCTSHI
jgi:hypothetical protein